jgi:hypothetical protein
LRQGPCVQLFFASKPAACCAAACGGSGQQSLQHQHLFLATHHGKYTARQARAAAAAAPPAAFSGCVCFAACSLSLCPVLRDTHTSTHRSRSDCAVGAASSRSCCPAAAAVSFVQCCELHHLCCSVLGRSDSQLTAAMTAACSGWESQTAGCVCVRVWAAGSLILFILTPC